MADVLAPGADLAKVYGESTRCPACGAFAQTLADPEHHWVCAVCGAPRVVMPKDEPLPEETAVALREAANAQRGSALQRLMSWAMGIPSGLALLLAIVLAPASYLAGGILVGAGVALALLASRASRKGATERKKLRAAVEHAYESAIAALVAKNQTPQEIAAGLRIAESEVETALAVSAAPIRVAVPMRVADSVAAEKPAPAATTDASEDAEDHASEANEGAAKRS